MFLVKMETGSTIIAVLLAALLQFIVKVKASDSSRFRFTNSRYVYLLVMKVNPN